MGNLLQQVKDAASGRWGDILPAIAGINPECLDGRHGPCPDPACAGTDRFRALDDFQQTGAVYCNGCFSERNGDGLAAIQHYGRLEFREALAAVAEHLGIVEDKPVSSASDPLRKQFMASGTNTEAAQKRVDAEFNRFCEAKKPITLEALKAASAELVIWPASNEHGKPCIAFKAEIRPGETTGYILRRVDGKDFDGFGRLQPRKTHMLRDSADGWVIPGGWERLARARVVWIVEGVPDALALFAFLPDDHAVATNICGAKACPQNIGDFAGKVVFVVGDADEPGQEGAIRKASKMMAVANSVKMVALPYEIANTHGKDLRDYFVDGHTFAGLITIAENSPEFEKPKRGGKSAKARDHSPWSRNDDSDKEPIDPWVDIAISQGRTEIANSRRFLNRHRAKVRYCDPWKSWLVWGGDRWQVDDSGAILRLAKEVSDSIWGEAQEASSSEAAGFAVESSKASKIAAMLKLASAEVPVDVAELDANPWLLNCINGTVDLRTGELRPHRQEDSITKICKTAFNPDAPSFHWDRFLESTFGEQSLIDFVQRFFGYCLTGLTTEQILTVFWGDGANGKTTILNAVQHAIGKDFMASAPPSLLMQKKMESHPTELADLFGRRLVVASETSQGARLAESTVKQLTGGDVISARRMRENFWTFTPTHKLILLTNHKPQIRGTDHAIWRRLLLVPFGFTFWNPDKGESGPPELKQDKALPAKLEAEAEGILAWMVRGCVEWQRVGLQIPQIVRAATDEYRGESDIVGQFISQCCIVGSQSTYRVKFSDLFEHLEGYCRDSGERSPSKKFVGQYLREHGFEDRQSVVRWYLGIAIKHIDDSSCVTSMTAETTF